MKKFISLLLSLVLVFSTACSSQSSNLSFDAGTYTATVDGRNGSMTIETTFDEHSIKEVKVTKHQETPGISDAPIQRIPQQIVENQSLNIDIVASATITSEAILNGVADCVKQANGDVEALKAVAKEDNKKTETVKEEAQIVIIGGGAAGMAAAVTAAENGAESIIVLEKTATLGGNAAISGGFLDCTQQIGTKNLEMSEEQFHEVERVCKLEPKNELMGELLTKLNKDFDEYKKSGATYLFDSPEFAALQYYEESKYSANLELLYEMQVKSIEVYDWFEEMGADWVDTPVNMIGGLWRRFAIIENELAGTGYFKLMEKEIEENKYPVTFHMETRAEELIVEDGKVVGVKATAADGTKYEIKATNGVLLATGGFSANYKMREKYNNKWAYVGENLLSTSKPSMEGDGIEMALAVGADLIDMGNIQMLPIADPETGSTNTFLGNTTNMFFNKEGKRFVDETKDRDALTNAILEQTDSTMYVLSSQNNAGITEDGTFFMTGMPVEDLIKNGDVIVGDTIEELAEKLGIDPATLKETVDTYNEAVRNGEDKEFGRIRFDDNSEYVEGPFYACPRKPASHNTKGGVVVNINTEVLDTEGNPIPGLYAAGEVTGGRYRSGMPEAFTTGRTAGKLLATMK